jgi:hypothetical protein
VTARFHQRTSGLPWVASSLKLLRIDGSDLRAQRNSQSCQILNPGAHIRAIVLAYTEQASHIRTLRVSPYEEFAFRQTRVEFEW